MKFIIFAFIGVFGAVGERCTEFIECVAASKLAYRTIVGGKLFSDPQSEIPQRKSKIRIEVVYRIYYRKVVS
jgi:hypothetical protein